MIDDLIDMLSFVVPPFLALCLFLFLPLGGIAAFSEYRSCVNRGEIMGVRYEWKFFGGCMYERNGQMLPEDRWFALEGIEK